MNEHGKKSMVKFFISDSQNTFILVASTPLELKLIIKKLKK